MDLGISGLASGFDWRSLIDQLSEVERAPERRLQSEQVTLQQRNAAYGNILTQLTALKTRVDALKDPALFSSRLARTGDTTIATASADAGAAAGIYTFNVTQRATASQQQGTANAGLKLNATNDVSALLLSNAAFASPVRAGTFTVNGKQVSIATSDTLQQVFDKISTATGGSVTASYDNTTDKITFAGAGEIVLGSSADTSNFLEAAKLANNGTATVTSSAALGVIKTSAKLATANFATALSDGGAGAGQFKINGVTINFNVSTDTVANVLARVNASAAGVTAS
ncbi:MAG TPA: flagellar cap protein FliD N-terminal domain-containing protein, partial [Verrucomicrobiae bacterium]